MTNCGSVCQLQTNDIAFINGINIKTPSNIIALAFTIVFPSSGQTVNVALNTTGFSNPSFSSPPSTQFYGVQTNGAVTNLTLTGASSHQLVVIDNVEAESQTAEVAPFILIGTGLLLLRLLGRRWLRLRTS